MINTGSSISSDVNIFTFLLQNCYYALNLLDVLTKIKINYIMMITANEKMCNWAI